jgi:restriction system protein
MMENDESLLRQLYSNLSPRAFEILIKDLLEKLGFDDVRVTGRTGDSGIDLKAILRKSEIPGIEINLPCIVQAKRFSPESTLSPRYIRELRGTLHSGERGILITTAKVSRKTINEETLKDPSRIILVIDGQKLIELCKLNEIGVTKHYMVDENYIANIEATEEVEFIISKLVTTDDIKEGILRIPSEITEMLDESKNTIKIIFEDKVVEKEVDNTGSYVLGFNSLFREHGLIDEEGNIHEKIAEWSPIPEGFSISFTEIKKEEKIPVLKILKSVFNSEFSKERGTPLFIGGREKVLCRYSKYYPRKDVHYWFGITPRDIDLISQQNISHLVFICSNRWVVTIEGKYFLSKLEEMSVARTKEGDIRHYHVHFTDYGNKIMWYLKGGRREELKDSYRLETLFKST